MKADREKRH